MTSKEEEFYVFIERQQKKILDSNLPFEKKGKLCSLILRTKGIYEKIESFYPEDSTNYFSEALQVISEYAKSGDVSERDFEVMERLVRNSTYVLAQLHELHNTLEEVREDTIFLESLFITRKLLKH